MRIKTDTYEVEAETLFDIEELLKIVRREQADAESTPKMVNRVERLESDLADALQGTAERMQMLRQVADRIGAMEQFLMQQPTSVEVAPAPKPEIPDDERWWTLDVAECRGGTHNTWRIKKSGRGRYWYNGVDNSESAIETWAAAEADSTLIELDTATGKPLEKK